MQSTFHIWSLPAKIASWDFAYSNKSLLEVCSQNDMYTILPNIIGDYEDIKKEMYRSLNLVDV